MSKPLIKPEGYQPVLNFKQTEQAIKKIKDFFENHLSAELRLQRVTAPLFVSQGTGINDDLNGVERPVSFPVWDMNEQKAEIVQSLAKWKRLKLADLNIEPGYGIYTDMNAIRPDEELGNMHSLFVDQWDWERVISEQERNLDFLKDIVNRIYEVLKSTEYIVYENYPAITPVLPEHITFIHSEELENLYPDMTAKEREHEITKKHGAVFIIGIGGNLQSGKPHDGRAPDYDDWSTSTQNQFKGLNGDILLWHPVLKTAFEITSMGIRVNRKALEEQLQQKGQESRKELLFHQRLINGNLPLSVGGGLGQSRLCMFFLRKAHVGEVQVSIWPEAMKKACQEANIPLM